MTRVLLVDDDQELTDMLRQYLAREGFEVTCTNNAEDGETEALSGRHDIVVLDIMMPRITGIEVLRRVRAQSQVPVILLTARGDNIDRIAGLELGADDYVPKPSSPGELVARLRAIMRRVRAAPVAEPGPDAAKEVISTRELTLWPSKREAHWQGQPLELTGNEFNLLEQLARNAGQLVSKQNLSMNALGRPLARYDRSIDVHISSIRQKLGPRNGNQSWIQSVRNLGYMLICQ